jgi:hypothetical protein
MIVLSLPEHLQEIISQCMLLLYLLAVSLLLITVFVNITEEKQEAIFVTYTIRLVIPIDNP